MERITVENVNHPGRTERVDAAKYSAMREALTSVLGRAAAPLTNAEIKAAVLSELPQSLFPGGATCGWWIKTVQLDLEAKGVMARTSDRPLRFHLSGAQTGG